VQNAFSELIQKMPEDGIVICNTKDPNIIPVIKNIKQKIVNYLYFEKYFIYYHFNSH
jgi:UDP-N-acetylmuramate-alanine ligase